MKKTVVLSLFLISLISLLSGFALSRNSQPVSIKMHIKDLPQHHLRLIGPSDPTFDERLRSELKGKSNETIDVLKPFSVFFENTAESPVVAYLIEWCFIAKDGRNQCYRKALLDPQPLMDGANLSKEVRRQQGWVEPDSARFLSLLSTEGGGMLRAEVSAEEAEEFRQGKKSDQAWLLRRFSAQAAKYAEITVSIDAAFFDDGTFVGPDTTNFFAQTQAAIDSKRDLLNEITNGLADPAVTTDSLYGRIQEVAAQSPEPIDSGSTPAEYYNYFKNFYARDILRAKNFHGQDKALAMSVQSMKQPWAKLRKKPD